MYVSTIYLSTQTEREKEGGETVFLYTKINMPSERIGSHVVPVP